MDNWTAVQLADASRNKQLEEYVYYTLFQKTNNDWSHKVKLSTTNPELTTLQ